MTRFEFDFNGTERFQVRRCLGQGGMGVVYEALDRETDTRVALKTLWRMDAQALYHFKNEFRLLQDIEHPNLVRLGELVYEDGTWFFTMEYVDGVDFLAYVRPGAAVDSQTTDEGNDADEGDDADDPRSDDARVTRPIVPVGFNESRLRQSAMQLSLAIAALHGANRIHRDIKPSNVMVTRDGRVVLLDFGLVTDVDQGNQDPTSSVVGTVAYMAPEQARTKNVGPEVDWYAFGLILYEALVGTLPFGGTMTAILMDKQYIEPPHPVAICADVPEDLDRLCMSLLQIDPKKRPTERAILAQLGVSQKELDLTKISSPSYSTFSSPFVGRHKEMAWLQTALEQVADGQQVSVFVQGTSGVGKSELVRRFTINVQRENPDAVVLTGRCYERESVPYNAFDGITDALSRYMMQLPKDEASRLLPRRADLLPQLFPVLRRVEVIAREPYQDYSKMEPLELRKRMFNAFRELLAVLGEHHPLILFIDDFQWASADSLMLFEELLHPPDPPRLLLVATERTSALMQGRSRDLRGAGKLASTARYLWLDRFPPKTSRELVTLLLSKMPGNRETLIDRIADEAEGHPMFIQELVRHLESGGMETAGAMRLDDALWARICRLPEPAVSLLEIIAVSGGPLIQEAAALAAQLPFDEFLKWSGLLRAASLARTGGARATDRIEPYHDRVREAVLPHVDSQRRKELHGRLAIALDQAGTAATDPHVLVMHFKAADDSERAAQHAAAAAHRASNALAFDQAAEFYRIALELGRLDETDFLQLQLALAEALVNAGRGAEAAEVFLEASKESDPALRLECERRAAEQLLYSGHVDQGLATMRHILSSMGSNLPESPKRALLSLLWRRMRVRMRGFDFKERKESQIAREDLMRADVLNSVASGLALVDTVRGMDFQARGLLAALETGETTRILRALAREATFLGSQGPASQSRARRLYRRCRQIAQSSSKPYYKAWMHAVDGVLHLFEGHLHEAAEQLARSEELFLRHMMGWLSWELNNVRLFRLWALLHGSAFIQLRLMYDHYMRDAERRGDRFAATSIRRSANITWLVLGSPAEARRELDLATWLPPEGTYHLQHWWELEARSNIALYEGSSPEALETFTPQFRTLSRSLLTRVQLVRCAAMAVYGRLALATAEASRDPSSNIRLASKLARDLMGERVGWARVWGTILRAGVFVLDGDLDRGAHYLRRVIDLASKSDMPAFTAAARRRLGDILGGDEGQALIAEANDWMFSERIADPDRMLEVMSPGFLQRR